MARNTSKNAQMQQHPEMVKAKAKPVRRAIVGGGSSGGDHRKYFEMTDSPAGGGEIIARAIHYDDKGANDLPEDAVVVNVFKQYAKVKFDGACKVFIFSRSELTPFDVSLYRDSSRKEPEDGQHTEGKENVSGTGEGQGGTEPARRPSGVVPLLPPPDHE